MNEITDSFIKNISKRFTSPLYGTFFISWLIFHWKTFIILFFVSEAKIWQATGLLKNDYLSQKIYNFYDPYFYIALIAPFILTYLIIWHFSKWFSLPAFKKDEEHKTKKKLIRICEQKKIEIEEINLEKENVKKLDIVGEKVKKNEEIRKIDPTFQWTKEYNEFEKNIIFKDFREILSSIYEYGGHIKWSGFNIPLEILSFSHSNDLINFIDGDQGKTIKLTEKGKFFVKKYNEKPYIDVADLPF